MIRAWAALLALFLLPAAHAADDASTPAAIAAVRASLEKLVDNNAVQIHGTILRIVYSIAAEDDSYLVRIDTAGKKSLLGQTIIIAQADPGKLAGQPWPAPGKSVTIYHVGTSPYDTGGGKIAVVPLYVPDREAAIIWASSQ